MHNRIAKYFLYLTICGKIITGDVNAEETVHNGRDDKYKYSIYLKGYYDFPGYYGTFSDSNIGGLSAKDGFGITGEVILTKIAAERVKIGLGMEYQTGRVLVREPVGGKFSFIPVYLTIYLFPIQNFHSNDLFVQFEVGRNFHTGNDEYNSYFDSKGGSHLGMGLGIISNNRYLLQGRLPYDSGGRDSYTVIYGRWSLSFGIIL